MYSDIIPPKKSIRKIKPSARIEREEKKDIKKKHDAEVFTPYKKTYHTMDGRDVKSKWPLIFIIIAILLISGILYSKYNHTTTFTFVPKTTNFEIKERIVLHNASDTAKDLSLPYNLVYIPSADINNLSTSTPRNPFIPQKNASSTSSTVVTKEYTMTASTTNDVKNIVFVNKTSLPISLRETTRISVGDVVYNLDKTVVIPPSGASAPADSPVIYHIVGFKDTAEYEKVYAIPAPSSNTSVSTDDSVSTIPPTDIISLLPKTSLPLLKSNIYDRMLDQNAVVVIEQKDLEYILQKINPSMQEYIKILEPMSDMLKYHITIVDYNLESSEETGRPIAFKSLSLEITPIINTEHAKTAFVHFNNEAMKRIKNQIATYIGLDIRHFPFWMTDVPDKDRVRVEIGEIAK